MIEKIIMRSGYKMLLAGALTMSGCLTSCDSSEVEVQDSLADYEKVLVQIVDEDGNYRFPKNKSNDVTVLGCQTENIAQGFVKGLTLGEYKGDEFTTLDMGMYGSVVVKRMDGENQFFQVEVRLKDYETTRLFLVAESYIINLISENEAEENTEETPVYVCSNCQTSFAYQPDICPICYNVPVLTIIPLPSISIDGLTIDFDMEVKI